MREPLEDDRVPYHDEPRYGTASASSGGATSSSYFLHHDEPVYGTASASSGGATSSSYIPAPPQSDFAGFSSTLFVPPSLFINIINIYFLSYATYVGEYSSYVSDPSFFSTPPSHVPYTYESMTVMFTDTFTFRTDYSALPF